MALLTHFDRNLSRECNLTSFMDAISRHVNYVITVITGQGIGSISHFSLWDCTEISNIFPMKETTYHQKKNSPFASWQACGV